MVNLQIMAWIIKMGKLKKHLLLKATANNSKLVSLDFLFILLYQTQDASNDLYTIDIKDISSFCCFIFIIKELLYKGQSRHAQIY